VNDYDASNQAVDREKGQQKYRKGKGRGIDQNGEGTHDCDKPSNDRPRLLEYIVVRPDYRNRCEQKDLQDEGGNCGESWDENRNSHHSAKVSKENRVEVYGHNSIEPLQGVFARPFRDALSVFLD